jgi:ABC-type branched-subunit amino acid transport system substrate-binding protein
MLVSVRKSIRSVAVVMSLALVTVGVATAAPAGAQVRGFDGETIRVAGMGIASQLPNTEIGVQARLKRFNDTNELKGITIEWLEMADDKQDPATALSEARRLVSQENVFALVGDISANNPGDYFKQQKVPYFGGGFDFTYCSTKASTDVWGFSDGGCIVPSDPSFIADLFHAMYTYVNEKTGKKHPTWIVVGNDNQSGKNGGDIFAAAAQGTGFKVTDKQTELPITPPADYTPYVNDILVGGANGAQPDSLFCEAQAAQCLGLHGLLQQRGFEGTFVHGIWTNVLVAPFEGSLVNNPTVNPEESNPGMDKLKADMEAFEPGSSDDVDYGAIVGYTSADMFIKALKTVAKKGEANITPENVQKAASTMKWQLKGVQGPINYPRSTVAQSPACFSLYESDGTTWNTAVPYTCSTKTYSPDIKLG